MIDEDGGLVWEWPDLQRLVKRGISTRLHRSAARTYNHHVDAAHRYFLALVDDTAERLRIEWPEPPPRMKRGPKAAR